MLDRVSLARISVAAALVAHVACNGRLPHPPYAAHPTSALGEVPFPPPPARVEEVPPRPTDDAVWLDGEWNWRGRAWSWLPGRWVRAPAESVYCPWTAVRDAAGRLFYAPGTWRNAKGEPIDDPAALARGRAASGVVFNARGEVERTGRTLDPDRARPRADGGT
jgi:hypothetical protein